MAADYLWLKTGQFPAYPSYSEFLRKTSFIPEITQRMKSNPCLIQSIRNQNFPPATTMADEPYSSAYSPRFQNNFKEMTNEIRLKTNITELGFYTGSLWL